MSNSISLFSVLSGFRNQKLFPIERSSNYKKLVCSRKKC